MSSEGRRTSISRKISVLTDGPDEFYLWRKKKRFQYNVVIARVRITTAAYSRPIAYVQLTWRYSMHGYYFLHPTI